MAKNVKIQNPSSVERSISRERKMKQENISQDFHYIVPTQRHISGYFGRRWMAFPEKKDKILGLKVQRNNRQWLLL